MRTPVYQAVLGPVCDAVQALPDVTLEYTSEYPERIRPLIGAAPFISHADAEWSRFDLYLNGDPWAAAGFAAVPTASTSSTASPASTIWIGRPGCRWDSGTTIASPSSTGTGCSDTSTQVSSPLRRRRSSATRNWIDWRPAASTAPAVRPRSWPPRPCASRAVRTDLLACFVAAPGRGLDRPRARRCRLQRDRQAARSIARFGPEIYGRHRLACADARARADRERTAFVESPDAGPYSLPPTSW